MNRADLETMAQRELQRQQAFRCRILCCASTPCLSSGGAAVYDAINAVDPGGRTRTPTCRLSPPAAWDHAAAAPW